MNTQTSISQAQRPSPMARESAASPYPDPQSVEELLPFTVSVVGDRAQLSKAVQIRHAAYARHVPVFAESLRAPESTDCEDGVVVLLAESKLDGSPLGTMRIQTNEFSPLSVEQSVDIRGLAAVAAE